MLRLACLLLLGLTSLALAADPPAPAERERALAAYRKGHVLWEEGRLQEAIPHVEEAVRLAPAGFGADDLVTADLHNRLGLLYYHTSQFAFAEAQFRHSLRIREAKLGRLHALVAESLNNLAIQIKEQGRHAEAEAPLRQALEFQERATPGEPAVADALDNLAFVLQELSRYKEAGKLFERALTIRRAKRGAEHPETAQSLRNVAAQLQHEGKLEESRKYYQESLRIFEAKLGPRHRKVAISLHSLAGLHLQQDRPAEAIPLLERCIAIQGGNGGKADPEISVGLAVENLAQAHAYRGDWRQAGAVMDQAMRLYLRLANSNLLAQPEVEQLTFLSTGFQPTLHRALSLGLAGGADPGLAAQSAAWLLNGKGLAHQTLAERALLDRDSKDPATAQLVARLTAARDERARLTYQARKKGQEAEGDDRLLELARKETELVKQLGERRGRSRKGDGWVALDKVRAALPDDAVLIGIARLARTPFKKWRSDRGEECYAAWVIPPRGKGRVEVVDLGPAEAMDDAIWAVRRALQKSLTTVVRQGEAKAEKELSGPLDALSRRVVAPLLKHVAGTRRWVVSPDGDLWLVPWAALRLSADRYVVEQHEVSYLVSGRDLLTTPAAVKSAAPLVLADPDFDLTAAKGKVPPKVDVANRAGALGDTRWQRLPGTAAEAKAIAPVLERMAKARPRVLTGAAATERAFKAAPNPRVLVLSTHGFFLEDQVGPAAEAVAGPAARGIARLDQPLRRPRRKTQGGPLENPLLRCGLVLAGANHPERAADGADDGVLTGLEIAGADLRGTELVVLSACETGLGQVHQGEGVAGLRQAFQLAGARAVASTLWKVADRETAQLVAAFFDQLGRGRPPAEALRAAQLAMIAERRREHGAAHPFFWAAFTLSGR